MSAKKRARAAHANAIVAQAHCAAVPFCDHVGELGATTGTPSQGVVIRTTWHRPGAPLLRPEMAAPQIEMLGLRSTPAAIDALSSERWPGPRANDPWGL